MSTKQTGDGTEAAILAALIERGHSVSVPFGDNDKYDLVVEVDTSLYRIQCKTAWSNKPETIRFNTHSQTTREGEYHEQTYQGEIDAFIIRYPPDGGLYWVDIEEATEQKMELRFEGEIDHPRINWASEYRFDTAAPE